MFTQDQRFAMTPLLLTINTCADDDKLALLETFAADFENTEAWALAFVGNHSLALLPESLRTDAVIDAALDRYIGQVRFLSPAYIESREGFFLRHTLDRLAPTGDEPWLENPDAMFEALWGLLAASKRGSYPLKLDARVLNRLQAHCNAEPPELEAGEYLWLMNYAHGNWYWREGESFGFTEEQHDAAIIDQWVKGEGTLGSWRSGQVFRYLAHIDGAVATTLLKTRMDVTGQGAYFPDSAGDMFLRMLQQPAGKGAVSWPLVLGFVAASISREEDFWLLLNSAALGKVACATSATDLLQQLMECSRARSLICFVSVLEEDGSTTATTWDVDVANQVAQVPGSVVERLLDEHTVSNLYCAPLDFPLGDVLDKGIESVHETWEDLLRLVYSDTVPN